MQWLNELMRALLEGAYGLTHSWGLAIILLTVGVRAVMYPLTVRQSQGMEVMKRLQPKIQELQKKYKDRPDEMQRRMMALYKEHNYNPLSGCLPLLLQFPILIGLFNVLRTYEFSSGFLWLNLSAPDPYYVMPVLSAVTTYAQMMQTATGDKSQRMMMMLMPVFIGWISISFPGGLVLYWVVSNLLGIVQQWMISRRMSVQRRSSEAT
ncbi:YidC/Oxa1 family membrane protein insertase [Limnochorda pilosa]|uniref:Membrane protein n=1 Tax=Limnochorda pilosa TaxID=1555112 RepID=A0A0K2SQP9_LIMPI|nr:YidC/Oxa1 family membrane protein insertase [Limnochorda pilosa]BAS29460.1 membrane protein [Limnochorda pilosa]